MLEGLSTRECSDVNQTYDRVQVSEIARDMRCDIVKMITAAGSGHPGGSLSAADIIATLYFGGIMRYDPDTPDDPSRDRFILSKGHAAPVLYAALAHAGYLPVSELVTLRKLGSRLQGHPDCRKCPGVEVSTGSLGQGLSIAAGYALGLRDTAPDSNIFVMLGDGEIDEGQIWEAAMFADHYRLGNLVAILDNNTLQIDGTNDDVAGLGSPTAKFEAFGWRVTQIDGHDVDAIHDALVEAVAYKDGPALIVAHTVKGKGVSFMEGQVGWHGKAPDEEQCAEALAELTRKEA